MVFAAAPNLAAKHERWSLDDIAAEALLTFASNTKPSRHIKELLTSDLHQPKMTTSTSLGALIRLAVSGLGICAIPRAVIIDEIDKGHLVELTSIEKLPPLTFTASYVSGSQLSSLMANISSDVLAFLQANHKNILLKSKN